MPAQVGLPWILDLEDPVSRPLELKPPRSFEDPPGPAMREEDLTLYRKREKKESRPPTPPNNNLYRPSAHLRSGPTWDLRNPESRVRNPARPLS